jgi:hypothetical protein
MFLTRLARPSIKTERGSALIAVIGVMAVGMVVTAMIATSVVTAFGQSTAARAGVQSHAAADAGIVAAQTGLFTPGNCAAQSPAGTYTSVALAYSVTVEYNAGAGWQAGCPPLTATQIRLISTGTAAAVGVAGASSGNTNKVEAVFNWRVPGPAPSGPSMYLYKGGQVEANSSFDLQDGDGTGLMVKNGDLTCDKNNTVINGSVAVFGNLTFTNKCTVRKNASVTGTAALGSGFVLGKLEAPAPVSPSDFLSRVGSYDPIVTMPVVPDWADVTYTPADWLKPDGTPYTVQPAISGLGCILSSGSMGDPAGEPVIYDARGCVGGVNIANNLTMNLTSDVVLFAESFNFQGLAATVNSVVFKSSTTAVHKLWFITPDYVDDDKPTCKRPLLPLVPLPGDQGDFTIKNGFTIAPTIQAMLYTPCAFDAKNGFDWTGQIYAGQFSHIQNNPKFSFVKMGIAGADLGGDGGGGGGAVTIHWPQPGAVVSMRDVN